MLRYLQNAKPIASAILCTLSEDDQGGVLQTVNMDQPDFPNENFLAAWRERKGLTQAELGVLVGTTGSVISLLESGDRQLSPKWLRRLADVFKIPTGYLLEHHPDNVPADVVETFASIPKEKQGDALAMLRALAKAS